MYIEKLLNEIGEARKKFMRGEISSTTYWNIRSRNLTAIIEYNKKK